MILLQNLPTMHWGNEEVSVLLAEAYRLKFAFADAPNHYKRWGFAQHNPWIWRPLLTSEAPLSLWWYWSETVTFFMGVGMCTVDCNCSWNFSAFLLISALRMPWVNRMSESCALDTNLIFVSYFFLLEFNHNHFQEFFFHALNLRNSSFRRQDSTILGWNSKVDAGPTD